MEKIVFVFYFVTQFQTKKEKLKILRSFNDNLLHFRYHLKPFKLVNLAPTITAPRWPNWKINSFQIHSNVTAASRSLHPIASHLEASNLLFPASERIWIFTAAIHLHLALLESFFISFRWKVKNNWNATFTCFIGAIGYGVFIYNLIIGNWTSPKTFYSCSEAALASSVVLSERTQEHH